jgi:C_GCAxxG_C_C family probable redox protein
MERRQFLSTCGLGMALGSGAWGQIRTEKAETKSDGTGTKQLSAAAFEYFIPRKLTCSESLLWAGCDCLGIKSDLVPDIALGLAGGVGLQGKTCGVLTGSAMVLSLAIAAQEKDYKKKKMSTLQAVGRMHKAFVQKFNHADCRSLCGLDLTTAGGRKEMTRHVKADTCAEYVRAGAELLAQELNTIHADD